MGLLDYFGGSDPSQSGGMDPRLMGILGALQAGGAANPPQAASRLPLARPSGAYILSQAAGGFGRGYGEGLKQQQLQAQTAGANLSNLNALQNYNMWAPVFGSTPLSMGDLQRGNFDQKTMQQALTAPPPGQAQGGPMLPTAPQGVMPPQGGIPQGQPLPSPSGPQIGPPPQPQQGPQGLLSPPMAPQGGASPMMPPQQAAQSPGTAPGVTGQIQQMPYLLRRRFAAAGGPPTSPLEDQAFNAGLDPDSPQVKASIQLEMQKASGQIIPPGRGFPGATWNGSSYQYSPSGIQGMGAVAGTQAMAGVPAKNAEEQFKQNLAANISMGGGVPGVSGGGPPISGNASSQSGSKSQKAASLTTPEGNVVPPAQGNQTIGPGVVQATNDLSLGQDTEKAWGTVRPTVESAIARGNALANALQRVQAGGFTTDKADIANNLRGLGMGDIADKILGATDTGAAKEALYYGVLDTLGQLKIVNQGTGGRILNSEFQSLLNHGLTPDMPPSALHNVIAQMMGGAYQTKNMIDDFYGSGRTQQGWRAANQFQSAYYKSNPMQNFVDYSEKAIGPFKGMSNLPTFSAPDDKNLQMLPKGTHFLDASGNERIKP